MATIKSSVTNKLRLLLNISCRTRPVQIPAVFVTVIMLLIVKQECLKYSPSLISLAKWVELNPGRLARKSICSTAVNMLIKDVILVKLGFHMCSFLCSYCLFTLILLFLFSGVKNDK